MDVIRLSPFPAVAANARASYSSQELVGRSVHGLVFTMGGTFTRAHIDNVRIRAAGKTLVEDLTGARIQTMNTYRGLPAVDENFYVMFGDPTARSARGQHLGDLDLSIYNANPLEIEVDVGGATNPTLTVLAIVGPPKMAMGLDYSEGEAATVRALLPTLVEPTAAVTRAAYPIGLGSQAGARVRALDFFHSNLTRVELRKGGDTKWDDVAVDEADILTRIAGGRVQTAGHYVLDFTADGIAGKALTTLQSNGRPWPMQVRLTTSGSDTIRAYADVHTAPPLI